jgi:hypothetical protein
MKAAKLIFSFILITVLGYAFFVLLTKTVAAYSNDPSTAGAPACNNSAPKAPWPFSAKAAGKNAVDLTWGKVDGASSWTVAYGVKSHKYIYGLPGYGNSGTRSARISNLPAGHYFFVLRANNGCMPGPFSNELTVAVGGGGIVQTVLLPKTVVSKVTPAPVVKQGTGVPPTVTFKPQATPYVNPFVATPTPAPQAAGWWQSITGFFKSLFGR